jgi:hypothetical protein
MTEWKNRTITLKQDGVEFGKVSAAKADALIYSWANDLIQPEELQGMKPEEYISQKLGLTTPLPATALHQLGHGLKQLKKEHQQQIVEAAEGKGSFPGDDAHLNLANPAMQAAVESTVPAFTPPVNPIPEKRALENMKVTTPGEATLLCKIMFMIQWLLTGQNENWVISVMQMAGYDPMEIKMQLERTRQQAMIAAEKQRTGY